MEYNTKRTQLKINDYGRNIYNLIQHIKNEPDRERRTIMATAIVDTMARIANDEKATEDYRRKYWVHLMIMANWDLDVDVPYEITPEENVDFKPQALAYKQGQVHYRHYGSVMERMVKRVAEYPEGEERDEALSLIAHAMKRDYLIWNNDTVEDELITRQLEVMSGNSVTLPESFEYYDFRDYLRGTSEERRANGTHKKKKKKKKSSKNEFKN